MVTWYEKLDFDENPFTTNPKKHTNSMVNVDDIRDEIYYRVNAGSLLVVTGKKGHGKTSLLMDAARRFGGKGNVAYVDCFKVDKRLNITEVLKGKYGFFGRLFNRMPKNMVLLLDNVQSLSKKNNDRIKYYFDQGQIKSIIFTSRFFSRAKFSDSLKDRIGNRVVTVPYLNDFEAVQLIRNRIGNSPLLNDELIMKIFKISNNNPRILLENCDLLAEHAVEKKRDRVQYIDLQEVLGVTNE